MSTYETCVYQACKLGLIRTFTFHEGDPQFKYSHWKLFT